MEVSGHLHSVGYEAGWVLWRRENGCLCSESNPGRPYSTDVESKSLEHVRSVEARAFTGHVGGRIILKLT
jgi:hypothetical protein